MLSKLTGFRLSLLWSISDCDAFYFFTSEESRLALVYLKDTASLRGMLQGFRLPAVTKLAVPSLN